MAPCRSSAGWTLLPRARYAAANPKHGRAHLGERLGADHIHPVAQAVPLPGRDLGGRPAYPHRPHGLPPHWWAGMRRRTVTLPAILAPRASTSTGTRNTPRGVRRISPVVDTQSRAVHTQQEDKAPERLWPASRLCQTVKQDDAERGHAKQRDSEPQTCKFLIIDRHLDSAKPTPAAQ